MNLTVVIISVFIVCQIIILQAHTALLIIPRKVGRKWLNMGNFLWFNLTWLIAIYLTSSLWKKNTDYF